MTRYVRRIKNSRIWNTTSSIISLIKNNFFLISASNLVKHRPGTQRYKLRKRYLHLFFLEHEVKPEIWHGFFPTIQSFQKCLFQNVQIDIHTNSVHYLTPFLSSLSYKQGSKNRLNLILYILFRKFFESITWNLTFLIFDSHSSFQSTSVKISSENSHKHIDSGSSCSNWFINRHYKFGLNLTRNQISFSERIWINRDVYVNYSEKALSDFRNCH